MCGEFEKTELFGNIVNLEKERKCPVTLQAALPLLPHPILTGFPSSRTPSLSARLWYF